ncbi:unnamed protein product, partial [Amoebophrya sp. A25]|eukprot:GSA25T00018546001.1
MNRLHANFRPEANRKSIGGTFYDLGCGIAKSLYLSACSEWRFRKA